MDLDPSQYNIARAAEVSTLANTVFYNEAQRSGLKAAEESSLCSPDSVTSTLTHDEGSSMRPSSDAYVHNKNEYDNNDRYETPALAKVGTYKKIDYILDRNKRFLEELKGELKQGS